MTVLRTDVPPSVAWRCSSCGDEGVISGWEQSPCDLRSRHLRAVSAERRAVLVPAETAAALRDLLLLDSDTERLIFRSEATTEGIVLVGGDDDLEELMGHVAAEANHEENRRRQRRLDDAFQVLSYALDAPRLP